MKRADRIRRLLLAALVAAAPISVARAQDMPEMPGVDALLAGAENMHPAGYFQLAAQLLSENPTEASKWLYVGQIRYRFHIAANPGLDPSGDPALFASLLEVVGRPVNERAGASFDRWVASMDAALGWDEAHDNGFTSKTAHARELAKVRKGLIDFRRSLDGRREEMERMRRENGLPVE